VSQPDALFSLLVAHKIYGVPQTINSANYVYFLAFQELFKLRDLLKADEKVAARAQNLEQVVTGVPISNIHCKGVLNIGMVTEELLNLHRGQGLELFWRDSLICPTEEEYIQMVNGSQCGIASDPENLW
jgi:geranylgeranyl diphosphate synthase type 3